MGALQWKGVSLQSLESRADGARRALKAIRYRASQPRADAMLAVSQFCGLPAAMTARRSPPYCVGATSLKRSGFTSDCTVVKFMLRTVYLMVPFMMMACTVARATEPLAEEKSVPVNMVEINEVLVTSGQPPETYFDTLSGQGYELVVNLAPPESHGSLMNEGGLVGERGIAYVNIPVDWDAPDPEHFALFRKVMVASRSLKTLVHCQVGFRASTFTFLYRVIEEKTAPDDAIESVYEVWAPNETWAAFADRILADHGVDFQLGSG